MEQRFARSLNRIQKLVETASVELQTRIRIALIGGLAVSAWGAVRATQDIDLLADSDPSPTRTPRLRDDLKRFFEAKRCKVEWRLGEPDDPIPLLLRLTLGRAFTGPEVDMLWAHKRWHQEALQRRIEIKSGKLRVFLLHPEDLILMKLDAGGPQDLLDVQTVLASHPPDLDIERLKRNAARIRVQKLLDNCLREAIEKTRSQ
jgi:hypothetical protein